MCGQANGYPRPGWLPQPLPWASGAQTKPRETSEAIYRAAHAEWLRRKAGRLLDPNTLWASDYGSN